MKTLARFGEVDMFWGRFLRRRWCKICDRKLDREYNKARKKWNKKHEKIREEIIKNGGIIERPIVGRSMMIDFTKNPKGEEIELCKGWYADDEGWRKRGIPNAYI